MERRGAGIWLIALLLGLFAPAAARGEDAWPLGPGRVEGTLSYDATDACGFLSAGGHRRSVPARGRYFMNELGIGANAGILDWLDFQGALYGAIQSFHDRFARDRTLDGDLDSAEAGLKATFLQRDTFALAASALVNAPASTHTRRLFGTNSVDTVLRLESAFELPAGFEVLGSGGFKLRTGGAADQAVFGLELDWSPGAVGASASEGRRGAGEHDEDDDDDDDGPEPAGKSKTGRAKTKSAPSSEEPIVPPSSDEKEGRERDKLTFYVPLELAVPVDRGDGLTRFGAIGGHGGLVEHRPTALDAGVGIQWRPSASIVFALEARRTVWGERTLERSTIALLVTFTFR